MATPDRMATLATDLEPRTTFLEQGGRRRKGETPYTAVEIPHLLGPQLRHPVAGLSIKPQGRRGVRLEKRAGSQRQIRPQPRHLQV